MTKIKKIQNTNTNKNIKYKWKSSGDVFKKISKSKKFQEVYNEEFLRLQLAQQIKQARIELNITQQVVAKRSGMTQSVIARIERGEHGVSLSTLGRISNSLGRSIKLV